MEWLVGQSGKRSHVVHTLIMNDTDIPTCNEMLLVHGCNLARCPSTLMDSEILWSVVQLRNIEPRLLSLSPPPKMWCYTRHLFVCLVINFTLLLDLK